MKQDFITNLYYGRYLPYERKARPRPEQAAIESRIEKERQYFSARMSPDDYNRFLNLEDLYNQSCGYDDVDTFAYGLRFGAMFMDAILKDGAETPAYDIEVPTSSRPGYDTTIE